METGVKIAYAVFVSVLSLACVGGIGFLWYYHATREPEGFSEKMILSFAWTTDALLAGRKTCTRRQWKDAHFQRWVNAYRRGNLIHDAADKVLFAGGKRVAKIRLTCEPYLEPLRDMPESDLQAEGGLWASKQEFISLFGDDPDKIVAVVRFELVEVIGDQP